MDTSSTRSSRTAQSVLLFGPFQLTCHRTINDVFGANHAADVIKQNRQLIFISREKLSQFVYTKIIPDETADSIREALLAGCIELIPESGANVRVDPGSSLQSLAREAGLENEDNIFKRFNIKIDLGRTHNINKNPIAENAVKEFLKERLRLNPIGGPITELDRIVITKAMNSRIRDRGLAAKEMLFRRDLITNEPKDISDKDLAEQQFEKKIDSHKRHIAKAQDAGPVHQAGETFCIGDRVYVNNSLSKTKGREEYRVIGCFSKDDVEWVTVRKADSQFRNKTYDLKTTEITRIQFGGDRKDDVVDHHEGCEGDDDVSEDNETDGTVHPPATAEAGLVNRHWKGPAVAVGSVDPLPGVAVQEKSLQRTPDDDEQCQKSEHLRQSDAPSRRSVRKRRQPVHLEDFVINTVESHPKISPPRRPIHGWNMADWEDNIDDEDDDSSNDKGNFQSPTPIALSERLIVTSPENDEEQEDLIDFNIDLVYPTEFAVDIMIGRQLDLLVNTSVVMAHENDDSTEGAISDKNDDSTEGAISDKNDDSMEGTISDTEDEVRSNIVDNVLSVGRQLHALEKAFIRTDPGGDYDSDDNDEENSSNSGEDDHVEDDNSHESSSNSSEDDADDEDDDSDGSSPHAQDDDISSDGSSRLNTPRQSSRPSSPYDSSPPRQLPPTWRGDSPRPGTSAARLTAATISMKRQEILRRRHSSSWDHFADINTPVTPEPRLPTNSDDVDVFSPQKKTETTQFRFPGAFDRERLNARSLPGRSIEQRDQAVSRRRRTLRKKPRICFKTLHLTGTRTYKLSSSSKDGVSELENENDDDYNGGEDDSEEDEDETPDGGEGRRAAHRH